jgi:hypothetical protein
MFREWIILAVCGLIQALVSTAVLRILVMNAGSTVLLFVVPALIIVLAVVLYLTTKEAGE